MFFIQKSGLNIILDDIERNQGSRSYVKAQMEMLKSTWNDFCLISFELKAKGASNAIIAIHKELQIKYTNALGRLNDVIACKSTNIELPTIRLPEFSGKNTEWRSFIELFDKIVHKKDGISDAVKMQYLKTNLKGDAAKLVGHIAPTAKNYQICYEILQQR